MKPIAPLFFCIVGFICLVLLGDLSNRMDRGGDVLLDESQRSIEVEVEGPPCADVPYPIIGRWKFAVVCVDRGIVTTMYDQPLTNERWDEYIKPVVDSLKVVDRRRNGWKNVW